MDFVAFCCCCCCRCWYSWKDDDLWSGCDFILFGGRVGGDAVSIPSAIGIWILRGSFLLALLKCSWMGWLPWWMGWLIWCWYWFSVAAPSLFWLLILLLSPGPAPLPDRSIVIRNNALAVRASSCRCLRPALGCWRNACFVFSLTAFSSAKMSQIVSKYWDGEGGRMEGG